MPKAVRELRAKLIAAADKFQLIGDFPSATALRNEEGEPTASASHRITTFRKDGTHEGTICLFFCQW